MRHSIITSPILWLFCLLFCSFPLRAAVYQGRVVDEGGVGVPFATVYLEHNPIEGTATNNDGFFTLSTDAPSASRVVISFVGYEKVLTSLAALSLVPSESQSHPSESQGHPSENPRSLAAEAHSLLAENIPAIVLHEQPIALEETVVMAKASRQKNKRKAMAQLLYKVFNRMQYDFPDTPTRYRIVSDVKMDSEQTPWAMEQMIASVVNIPEEGQKGHDSIQFAGEYCKRFFQQTIRNRADTILAGTKLHKDLRKMANELDSGVVVHHALWSVGNIKYDFESTMNDIRHWSVSRESETETVLTHIEKKNYIGIFKYEYRRNYIVDSHTFRVLRFSEELRLQLAVPFGYKFKADELELLNLLNMSDAEIEKFRLKKADAVLSLNTVYQFRSGKLYPLEKNLHAKAHLVGTKDKVIPIDVQATQRVTKVQPNATPLSQHAITRRVPREIVPIY